MSTTLPGHLSPRQIEQFANDARAEALTDGFRPSEAALFADMSVSLLRKVESKCRVWTARSVEDCYRVAVRESVGGPKVRAFVARHYGIANA